MKFAHLFSGVFQPLWWFTPIISLWASCPFDKVSEFLELLVYPSDLSRLRDFLTFEDFFNLPFQVTFAILSFSWGLFSIGSLRNLIVFEKGDVKY